MQTQVTSFISLLVNKNVLNQSDLIDFSDTHCNSNEWNSNHIAKNFLIPSFHYYGQLDIYTLTITLRQVTGTCATTSCKTGISNMAVNVNGPLAVVNRQSRFVWCNFYKEIVTAWIAFHNCDYLANFHTKLDLTEHFAHKKSDPKQLICWHTS